MEPSNVRVAELTQGVTMSLVKDERGWKFWNWQRDDGSMLPPPQRGDLERSFRTMEGAIAYFRTRYVQELAASASGEVFAGSAGTTLSDL